MATYIQVMTATASKADAQKVARAVVEARLAGCAQIIGPIASTFWWEGEVQEEDEYLCLIKTRADAFDALANVIKEAHPYDVPEILATPFVNGNQGYLDWLDAAVTGDSG